MAAGRTQPVVRLKSGREQSVKNRHPWIFSGALQALPEGVEPGATVAVMSSTGQPLGSGAASPTSQIAIRLWSFDPGQAVDEHFFKERLQLAVDGRRERFDRLEMPACRLVNAESDGLPGLVVDRYADFLVCQFLSAGAEYWKATIVDLLNGLTRPRGIYERSDVEVRAKEGLEPCAGVLRGDAPPDLVTIRLGGVKLLVDIRTGHKTGCYLDQAENLRVVASHAQGREMLNCFAYTGAFGIAALSGGAAHVLNLDSSGPALELARRNAELNGFSQDTSEMLEGDVFTELRHFRDARRDFDLIVLDPPKFAANAAQVQRAARAYKDINLLALKLLRPGGTLVTFSCSGHVSAELFQKIVAGAAVDAARDVQITGFLSQAGDHPVATSFPQGHYLKGLVCRVS